MERQASLCWLKQGENLHLAHVNMCSVKYLDALILSQFSKRGLGSWELTFKVIVPLIPYIFLEQVMCFALEMLTSVQKYVRNGSVKHHLQFATSNCSKFNILD